MGENADILLYGCSVGEDSDGVSFLESFSQYTQADILASADLTGSEDLGGDWDLEYAIGNIEAELAFDANIKDEYQSTLVGSNFDLSTNPVFNDYIDTNFPVTGDFTQFNYVFNSDLTNPVINSGRNFKFAQPSQLNNIFGINLDRYNYNNSAYNSILFNFEPSQINFDSTNFNFSSMSMGSKFIKFNFEPSDFNFDFGNDIGDIDFSFDKHRFEFDSMFGFNAKEIEFNRNSVEFRYDPSSFSFTGANLLQDHSNLLDYKFTDSQISNINENANFFRLNASDYRAMNYAFDGDFMFDYNYYLEEYDVSSNMNPFADYIENGVQLDRDPNAVFDNSYYNGNNPDVAASGTSALEDYMRGGWRIGLIGDPNYDPRTEH